MFVRVEHLRIRHGNLSAFNSKFPCYGWRSANASCIDGHRTLGRMLAVQFLSPNLGMLQQMEQGPQQKALDPA